MSEYKRGFDDAIEKVRQLAWEQSENYAKLHMESPKNISFMERFDRASIAITDFSTLLHDLFQCYAIGSEK